MHPGALRTWPPPAYRQPGGNLRSAGSASVIVEPRSRGVPGWSATQRRQPRWDRLPLECRRASRSLWTTARTTGRWCAWGASWAGPAGVQDVQDASRRVVEPVLGQSARYDADGATPCQPYAGADSPRAAGRARAHDHGRRDQRDAIISRSLTSEGKGASGLFWRTNGDLDLSTLGGPGLGYRLREIEWDLPAPAATRQA